MIKNAQNSTHKPTRPQVQLAAVPASGVSSETKKIRKASSGVSTFAPVVRAPQGETVETVKTEARAARSLGPVRVTRVVQGKSGKKPPVIIRKAGPTSAVTSPVGAKFSSGDSTGRTTSEPGRGTPLKTGAPPAREGGLGKKGGRDLRSLISITNPERSLISAQNLPFLRRFVTEQGKILSRRLTRVTARQQREITKAIKQARILGYLQFVNTK